MIFLVVVEVFEECGERFCRKVLRCAKRIGGRVTSVDGAVPHKTSRNLSAKVYKMLLFFKLSA